MEKILQKSDRSMQGCRIQTRDISEISELDFGDGEGSSKSIFWCFDNQGTRIACSAI